MKKLFCLVLCLLFVFGAALPAFAECAHAYTTTVVPPTCTEDGYVLRVCSKCGDTVKGEIAPATGHSYGAWTAVQKNTCVQEGIWERTCS